jgi:hypothetical protein
MAWKENFASSHKAEADSQFVCRIARNLSSTHGESREKEHHAEQRGRTVMLPTSQRKHESLNWTDNLIVIVHVTAFVLTHFCFD